MTAVTLVFADTETTSLRADRRAWDVGLVVRRPGLPDEEFSWFVRQEDLDLANADLRSLEIGRFYERHPEFGGTGDVLSERDVLMAVERETRSAFLAGCVPYFDAEVLGDRMRANGICPSWHYHLIDCETLISGSLAAQVALGAAGIDAVPRPPEGWPHEPPWHSEELSQLIGVDPARFDRHTALGDALWARALYDAVLT